MIEILNFNKLVHFLVKMDSILVKRRILLIVLLLTTVTYALIVFIPMGSGKEIREGTTYSNEHSWSSARYRFKLVQGRHYKFSISTDSFWSMDPEIRIFQDSFKLMGLRVDSTSVTYESIVIIAEHSGYYYADVKFSNSGYYAVTLELVPGGGGTTPTYFLNSGKLALLVVPFLVFTSIYIIGIVNVNKNNPIESKTYSPPKPPSIEAKTIEKEPQFFQCHECGATFSEDRKFCLHCGNKMR